MNKEKTIPLCILCRHSYGREQKKVFVTDKWEQDFLLELLEERGYIILAIINKVVYE